MNFFTGAILLFIKGAAMGAANVIPGVSGGTIAFITGIYERLINALKSLDLTAVKLLLRFDLLGFARHVDLYFLGWLMAGVMISILTLAKLLEFLFEKHPVYIWAFFFGLILASIYFVGKMVKQWTTGPVVALVAGVAIAVAIALLTPASENQGFLYLIICGVVAVSSMIVPGLSGSFVLLLMGNYMLIIGSISSCTSALKEIKLTEEAMAAIKIMIPVGIGCVVGLVAFSHVLSWVFRKYHDIAVALMSGFVAGSLLIIWPWKNEVYVKDTAGELILRKGEKVIGGYDWYLPVMGGETILAVALMAAGMAIVYGLEKTGGAERGSE